MLVYGVKDLQKKYMANRWFFKQKE